MADSVFGAVIPAAGRSSRMEGFKPLLTVGGRTLVERAVRLFHSAGLRDVVVVAGHRADELITALEGTPCRAAVNPRYREGMLSSVQTGARELKDRCDAFFVLPVDIPLVRSTTIRLLSERFTSGTALVCHPVFGSRGHPPLIDASLIDGLLAWRGRGGLKAFLGQFANRGADVPAADAWIHRDVDTDGDLARLRRDFERYTIPTRGECEVILEHHLAVPEKVRAHGRTVALAALRLGEAVNDAGEDLDPGLLTAAGLLHDAFKGQEDHAGQAAAWLYENGFPEIAGLVGEHMDLQWGEGDALDEKAVLYLADKVVEGERVVPVAQRRAALLERYGGDEEARRAVARRLDTAEKIRAAVEKRTGLTFTEILGSAGK